MIVQTLPGVVTDDTFEEVIELEVVDGRAFRRCVGGSRYTRSNCSGNSSTSRLYALFFLPLSKMSEFTSRTKFAKCTSKGVF